MIETRREYSDDFQQRNIAWENEDEGEEKIGQDRWERESYLLRMISCQSSLCFLAAPVRNICVHMTSINCLEDFWIDLANELNTSNSLDNGPSHCRGCYQLSFLRSMSHISTMEVHQEKDSL